MLKVGYYHIIKIAIPVMLGTFIQNIVMITDAILVNKLGTVPFDAVNNAGLLYVIFFMLNKGLGDGTQIQIAKEYGQNNLNKINNTLNHSFIIQLFLSVIFIIFLIAITPVFTSNFVNDIDIAQAMNRFIDYRAFGLVFAGIQVSIIAFFIGIGKTKIIIFSALFLALINIFLDFGLIFGYFGFPEMGYVGAALASTIAEALTCIGLFIYLIKNKHLDIIRIKWIKKPEFTKIKALLKLSSPLMLGGFLSIATWFVFFSFIEQQSKFDLEVSHVVRNLFFISFIPIFGFGATTRTYVAYFIGKKDIVLAKKSMLIILKLSAGFYLLFFHGAIFYPKLLASLITDSPETINKAAEILQLIFGSMFLFALVAIFYNSITAIGKTKQALYIEIIAITIYLIYAYQVTIKWNWDIFYVWTVEYIYFGILGLLSILYLWYYNRNQII